jgi:hypothetical protein
MVQACDLEVRQTSLNTILDVSFEPVLVIRQYAGWPITLSAAPVCDRLAIIRIFLSSVGGANW